MDFGTLLHLFIFLDGESVFSDKEEFCLRSKKFSTTDRLYREVVSTLQAGSLLISSSNKQKETLKVSGRQNLFFQNAQITKRKLSGVKLFFSDSTSLLNSLGYTTSSGGHLGFNQG